MSNDQITLFRLLWYPDRDEWRYAANLDDPALHNSAYASDRRLMAYTTVPGISVPVGEDELCATSTVTQSIQGPLSHFTTTMAVTVVNCWELNPDGVTYRAVSYVHFLIDGDNPQEEQASFTQHVRVASLQSWVNPAALRSRLGSWEFLGNKQLWKAPLQKLDSVVIHVRDITLGLVQDPDPFLPLGGGAAQDGDLALKLRAEARPDPWGDDNLVVDGTLLVKDKVGQVPLAEVPVSARGSAIREALEVGTWDGIARASVEQNQPEPIRRDQPVPDGEYVLDFSRVVIEDRRTQSVPNFLSNRVKLNVGASDAPVEVAAVRFGSEQTPGGLSATTDQGPFATYDYRARKRVSPEAAGWTRSSVSLGEPPVGAAQTLGNSPAVFRRGSRVYVAADLVATHPLMQTKLPIHGPLPREDTLEKSYGHLPASTQAIHGSTRRHLTEAWFRGCGR